MIEDNFYIILGPPHKGTHKHVCLHTCKNTCTHTHENRKKKEVKNWPLTLFLHVSWWNMKGWEGISWLFKKNWFIIIQTCGEFLFCFSFCLFYLRFFCLWCWGLNLRPYTRQMFSHWATSLAQRCRLLIVNPMILTCMPIFRSCKASKYGPYSSLPSWYFISHLCFHMGPFVSTPFQDLGGELFSTSNLHFLFRKEFLKQRQAAVTLQATWRGHCQRKNFELVREKAWEDGPSRAAEKDPWKTHHSRLFLWIIAPGRKHSIASWYRIQIFFSFLCMISSPVLGVGVKMFPSRIMSIPQSWTGLMASLLPTWSQHTNQPDGPQVASIASSFYFPPQAPNRDCCSLWIREAVTALS